MKVKFLLHVSYYETLYFLLHILIINIIYNKSIQKISIYFS